MQFKSRNFTSIVGSAILTSGSSLLVSKEKVLNLELKLHRVAFCYAIGVLIRSHILYAHLETFVELKLLILLDFLIENNQKLICVSY